MWTHAAPVCGFSFREESFFFFDRACYRSVKWSRVRMPRSAGSFSFNALLLLLDLDGYIKCKSDRD